MEMTGFSWDRDKYNLDSPLGTLKVLLMKNGDEDLLLKFSIIISEETRRLFAPYHWGTKEQISEFRLAINKTENKEDVSFIVLNSSNIPAALLYLWSVSREYISNNKRLRIPTLGICVADEYQGRGIGKASMEFLKKVASSLKVDSIELTTVVDNTHAIKLYLECGFNDIGLLNIPIGIDPSTTNESEIENAEWRKERHMVYVINQDLKEEVMNYLLQKQIKFNGR